MKRNSFAFAVGFLFCFSMATSVYAQTDGRIQIKKSYQNNLTLKQALVKTLNFSPELSALSLEKRAREARTLQSGLLPNPSLNVYTEDVAGSGPFEGFKQSETTIQLGQLIELGSKRSARVKANQLSEKMSDWDYETKRLELLTKVSKNFLDVLKAQHKVGLTQKLLTIAKQAYDIVAEKVKSGKAASIEKVKAKIALSSIKIELSGAKLELNNARLRLASFWGNTQPKFSKAVGDFFLISAVPSSDRLLEKLSKNPNLARWSTELKRRRAALNREEANGVPNIQVNGGLRHLETTNDQTLRFGITVPIQLFNRNQGAIAEAKSRLEKTREEKRAMQLNTTQEFFKAYNALVFSHSQVSSIESEILPEAQKAFEATQEGYKFGKFGLREVLESQKTWFESQKLYIEALTSYHKANIDVEGLTGTILTYKPSINKKPERKVRQ
jgi:outer membrane protein, heavy metal efflux system